MPSLAMSNLYNLGSNMIIVRQLANVNWASLAQLRNLEDGADLITASGAITPTVLPQLMAFLSASISLVREDNNLISIDKTILAYVEKVKAGKAYFSTGEPVTEHIFLGMLSFLSYKVRGAILPKGLKQSSPGGLRWAANVPLFFSAFKEFRDIGYGEWDWASCPDSYLNIVLDPKLVEVLKYSEPWNEETLLAIRSNALPIKTGAKAGSIRDPETCTTVFSSGDISPEFPKVPSLVRLMLCQLWIFCPKFRHKLGWYSTSLDSYPNNLIGVEVGGALPIKEISLAPWEV